MTVKVLPGRVLRQRAATSWSRPCSARASSACIHDPRRGIGGMNHFMLPERRGERDGWSSTVGRAARYGIVRDGAADQRDPDQAGGQRDRPARSRYSAAAACWRGMTDVGAAQHRLRAALHRSRRHEPVARQDLGDTYPRRCSSSRQRRVHACACCAGRRLRIGDRRARYLEASGNMTRTAARSSCSNDGCTEDRRSRCRHDRLELWQSRRQRRSVFSSSTIRRWCAAADDDLPADPEIEVVGTAADPLDRAREDQAAQPGRADARRRDAAAWTASTFLREPDAAAADAGRDGVVADRARRRDDAATRWSSARSTSSPSRSIDLAGTLRRLRRRDHREGEVPRRARGARAPGRAATRRRAPQTRGRCRCCRARRRRCAAADRIIAIGASTGGTEAIREVLEPMPPDCAGDRDHPAHSGGFQRPVRRAHGRLFAR